ncbi:S41 family peptidase [Duganella sp. Dugasp56]|uniref:S41 family peptidase n=1 Tax=Duganella sp. Dugasp56 TaxID=3243046 RepID=UPI0039AF5B7C
MHPALVAVAILSTVLSGCGGDSRPVAPGGPVEPAEPPVTPPVEPPPVTPPVTSPVTPPVEPPLIDPDHPPDWITLKAHCENPQPGSDDVQGTLYDEMKWLRSFFDATYLWYKEIPTNLRLEDYRRAVDYFAVLKTPVVTASGRLKDRFHFTYPTPVWEALSNAGTELGYGLTWVRNADPAAPRVWRLTMVHPDSPGAAAGLRRGDNLVSVDGVAIADSSAAGLAMPNAGLFPAKAGETHQFILNRAGVQISVAMTSVQLAKPPVQNVKLLDTPTGKVGYLLFNEHNAVAEGQLFSAFTTLKQAGIADLVLDMRYNGGGYLSIAAELAYMIAGPQPTAGKVFERPVYNDKTVVQPPQYFQATAMGYKSAATVKNGTALPYLGLKRVTVLTTPGTCSASESVINSLRGVDIEVNLVGGETCGKPYAFTPADNCGTTYFAIQFQGVNNKGFGDYADGFAPTCRADDDLAHALGDPAEGVLAAALSYRATGACPAVALRSRQISGGMLLVRPEAKEISIRDR